MLRSWLEDPDLLLVRMELTIEGSRQAEVAEILQVQWVQLVRLVEHAMEATGKEHSPVARPDPARGDRRRAAAGGARGSRRIGRGSCATASSC